MKNYFDVKGKVAIVTGASSGLGRQFAVCLAEQGANIAIVARRVEKLEEVKTEVEGYGVKCLVLPCDVTDTQQIKTAVETTVQTFGRIDILINNAAAGFATPAVDTSDELWRRVMETTVTSAASGGRPGDVAAELRQDHQYWILPLPGHYERRTPLRIFHGKGRGKHDDQSFGS